MAKIPNLYAEGFEHGISYAKTCMRLEISKLRRKQRNALVCEVTSIQGKIAILIQLADKLDKVVPDPEFCAIKIRDAAIANPKGVT